MQYLAESVYFLAMKLDQYRLIKSLGKGGMGEVYLAEDCLCQRQVAIKYIREDLRKFKSIRDRFLREARIAAKLNHPSIIPIFSIHNDPTSTYYTMPYVAGQTLKEILKDAKTSEQKGAIPYLIRIFLNVCQAIAYVHSKKILHRDLKPENVIVGTFGEVVILDWGLAEYIDSEMESPLETDIDVEIPSNLTKPGKVVGTLAYLAPERIQNGPASEQTDLYALGVILYQILTLQLPFKRVDLEHFHKIWKHEKLIDPTEIAPYRDIPHMLSEITKKCLHASKQDRYQNVQDLVTDLERFVEGRPEWIPVQELKIEAKEDWEFQENVLLAKHMAITRSTEIMEWVNLMISKKGFPGNTKLETKIQLKKPCSGIGFLLNVPEPSERKTLMDGYCIWIGSKEKSGCNVFRCNIEVMQAHEVYLEPEIWYTIQIEKTESHLKVFINDLLKIHYISHTPLGGTHIGLLLRDADLTITGIRVFNGSQNAMVSCLAIPDAFLANKSYPKALSEYKKIVFSFPGSTEGREALFRSGVTLLEAGLAQPKLRLRHQYLSRALEEFGYLGATAGAPLEYLGKSLVYKALDEVEEESKCMELAIRKYSHHPLFPRLVEHMIFRLHEASSNHRIGAYHFALLCLRYLPYIFKNPDHDQLLQSMQSNWEVPFFLSSETPLILLAFFLVKPLTLLELSELGVCVEDALYALLELGQFKILKEHKSVPDYPSIQMALLIHNKGLKSVLKTQAPSIRLCSYLFYQALDEGKIDFLESLVHDEISKLWCFLLQKKWDQAKKILDHYSSEQLFLETSPLFPLYGCYLAAIKGKKASQSHLCSVLERLYPPVFSLLGHFLSRKINFKSGWISKALFWEKVQLMRQLILFYHCLNQPKKAQLFRKKLKNLKRSLVSTNKICL